MPRDTLALDKSARVYDEYGRLRVEFSHITKAMICPYFGKEIPGYEQLGLDGNRIYKMLRHPDEIKKAADSFSNLPLLLIHKATTATAHDRKVVVGTVGATEWKPPYLDANLCVWDQEGIACIESGAQAELSCGYGYLPDMTPGAYEGENYDGVMRDMVGNHVTLVDVGRAGSDVVVADKSPFFQGKFNMKLKTAQAQMLAGALSVYLKPKLAQDAAVGDLGALLANVKAATFAKERPALVASIKAKFHALLAQDQNLSDLDAVLASLAMDADSDEDEEDDPDNPGQRRKKVAKDATGDLEGNSDDGPTANQKQAMDAAIAAGVARAVAKIKTELQAELATDSAALAEARIAVAPLVGVVALDSAAAVYRFALDHAGVKTAGVDPSAFKPMYDMLAANRATAPAPAAIALDAAAATAMKADFADLGRIGRI